MVEYGIMVAKNFSFSLSSGSSELIAFFLLGGIVLVVIGYWIKKMTGAILALLIVLFAYLYFAGFFSRIIG
jgi:predicted RND superfamily exporter protein